MSFTRKLWIWWNESNGKGTVLWGVVIAGSQSGGQILFGRSAMHVVTELIFRMTPLKRLCFMQTNKRAPQSADVPRQVFDLRSSGHLIEMSHHAWVQEVATAASWSIVIRARCMSGTAQGGSTWQRQLTSWRSPTLRPLVATLTCLDVRDKVRERI